MTAKLNQGGAYIDFGEIPSKRNEPGQSAPVKAGVEYKQVVKIAWILVVSLIASLAVIIFLSVGLNRANQTIDRQRQTINKLSDEINGSSSKR